MIIAIASSSLTKSVFTPEYAHFAARIVEIRKAAGLTQVELALRLGRPQSYVSKYERGERRLDVLEFLAVTRALDTDAAGFVAELERLREKPTRRPPAASSRGRTGNKPKMGG
jgi:transcriptional regulator with XRE-family HTH domain